MSAERTGTVVAHLSDCHVDDRPEPLERLRRTVDAVRTLGTAVDLVMLTGDVAQDGRAAQYRTVLQELDRLHVPVVVCPGNHDVREAFAEVVLAEPATGAAPLHRVHTRAGLHVLALDSTVPGADHGTLDPAVVDWAVAELADMDPEAPALVALHHAPLRWHPDQLRSLDPAGTAVLRSLLRAVPAVRAVLGGHFHHAMSGALDGVAVLVAPSVAPRISPPWEPVGAVVDVEPAFAVHSVAPVGAPTSFFRRVP